MAGTAVPNDALQQCHYLCLPGAGITDVYYHSSVSSLLILSQRTKPQSISSMMFVCLFFPHPEHFTMCVESVCAIREEVKGKAEIRGENNDHIISSCPTNKSGTVVHGIILA